MSEPTPPPRPAPSRAGTIALLVIGLLILVPSGLCTAAFGIGALWDSVSSSDSEALSILASALVVGGPFIVVGGLLVWAGIVRLRRK